MTQGCAGPGSQHDGPQLSIAAGDAREGGVYAGLQALPAAGAQLILDCVRAEPTAHCLAPRYDTGLLAEQVLAVRREIHAHASQRALRPGSMSLPKFALWITAITFPVCEQPRPIPVITTVLPRMARENGRDHDLGGWSGAGGRAGRAKGFGWGCGGRGNWGHASAPALTAHPG